MAEEDKVKKVMNNFSNILSSLGEYLISMGKIEEENPDFLDFVNKMKHEPEYFDMFMEKLPEEQSKEILHLFLQMINLQDRAKHLEKLEPLEKIKLGNDLKKLAERYSKTFFKLKKVIEDDKS